MCLQALDINVTGPKSHSHSPCHIILSQSYFSEHTEIDGVCFQVMRLKLEWQTGNKISLVIQNPVIVTIAEVLWLIHSFNMAHQNEAVSKNEANSNSCDYYHMEEVIHEDINAKLNINCLEHLFDNSASVRQMVAFLI